MRLRNIVVAMLALAATVAVAQNPQMEEKLMAIKQNMVKNKQQLAQYTWTQTETIGIKGSTKDTKVYQVRMVNGQQQKTEVADEKAQSGGRQGGRMKQRIVEKKTDEYKEYGQQIGGLAKLYTTPDPDRLMQAKQSGNLSLVPGSGTISLVIKSFVQPGDQVTFTINDQTKSPVSVEINTYLNDPKSKVMISAQFADLPDGTNHVTTATINGEQKQLVIQDTNSNYQKIM